jgi:hypothetical protein
MLGITDLPHSVRRNLVRELIYSVSAGLLSGLALLSQLVVVRSLSGNATHVTVIVAAMPACSLLQPFWAAWARRIRLQQMVVISGILRSIPFLALSWVSHAWAFTALMVLYYFLSTPVNLAVSALYKYTYPDTHRGRIMGLLRLVQNSVTVPAMLIAAGLMDIQADLYAIIYPISGVIGIIGLFFYQRLEIPDDRPEDRALYSELPTPRNIVEVLRRDDLFRLFQATIFLTGAGFLMSRSIWIYLLDRTFALSQVHMTLLVQVLPVLLGALTAPWWGALIDRTSPVAGRVVFAWMGIFAYFALFLSFWQKWLMLAWAGAILRGIVLGASEVAQTTGNLYFALRRERAAVYESISSVFQGTRGLVMPLLGLALFQWIGVYIFLVPTLLNLWSLYVAWRLWRLEEPLRNHIKGAAPLAHCDTNWQDTSPGISGSHRDSEV